MEKHYQMRSAMRVAISIEAQVSEDALNWLPAHVDDISSGGLKFLVDKTFSKGDILYFDLRIDGVTRDFLIRTTAEVIRSNGTENNAHIYSVRFKDIPDKDQIELDEFVHYNYVHGDHRHHGQHITDEQTHNVHERVPHHAHNPHHPQHPHNPRYPYQPHDDQTHHIFGDNDQHGKSGSGPQEGKPLKGGKDVYKKW